MRDSAIYFPYIDAPNSAWFTRVLLYWDTVSSIVPFDYARAPENHAPYMRDLVASQLVTQLFPGAYLPQIPGFGKHFIDYVQQRRRPFRAVGRVGLRERNHDPVLTSSRERVKVHVEKTGEIGPELVRLGLASEANYPWYEMERWVANAFMTYLATALGALEEVDGTPVTQDRNCFQLLAGPVVSDRTLFQGRRYLAPSRRYARAIILREVFPLPKRRVKVSELAAFKEQHGDKLGRLRNAIEEKCVEIAGERDPEVRRERATRVSALLRDEIAEAEDAIRISWGDVAMTGIASVLGAAVGMATAPPDNHVAVGAAVSTLFGAGYAARAPWRRRNAALKRPLAYAALAHVRFG